MIAISDLPTLHPKCHKCWDKGYSTQLVNMGGTYDFVGDKTIGGKVKEIKNYCSCKKGKRLKVGKS